jgi:GNAT superfamily N-acetyltransferase
MKLDRTVIRIRPFEPSDAATVSHIVRTTMRASNAADYPIERLQLLIDYFSPEKVHQLNRDRACLVAELHDAVVGTAALEASELVTFFVLPEHQSRGVGAALLARLEAEALARGWTQLTVHASLTGAGFYERRGYQRTGQVVDGTAGPQISMEKRLS